MSSAAQHVLGPPGEVAAPAATPGMGDELACEAWALTSFEPPPSMPRTLPQFSGALSASAALRVECSRDGFARVRSFTRDTLRDWSLDHRRDDTALVVTELTANAATHAAPGTAGVPEILLEFLLDPTHVLVTVSDPDDHPPVHASAGSGLEEHGRGLCIVEALAEEWGWVPRSPVGKTVWARLSTCPPI